MIKYICCTCFFYHKFGRDIFIILSAIFGDQDKFSRIQRRFIMAIIRDFDRLKNHIPIAFNLGFGKFQLYILCKYLVGQGYVQNLFLPASCQGDIKAFFIGFIIKHGAFFNTNFPICDNEAVIAAGNGGNVRTVPVGGLYFNAGGGIRLIFFLAIHTLQNRQAAQA